MALYIATDNSHTSLIAKCITEQQIIDAIQLKFGPKIGQLRYELHPQHAYNSRDIITQADITGFEDGWVYPNGTYISQELFPEAYDALHSMVYDDILVSGSPKTKIFRGIADGKDYHLIQLPKIEGYFYPNVETTKNTIKHNNAKWQLKNHVHRLSFDADDDNADNELAIRDGVWIWTTSTADNELNSDDNSPPVDHVFWGNDQNQVEITKTAAVHKGQKYPNSSQQVQQVQWDIPIIANDNVTSNMILKGTSGPAINVGPSHSVSNTASFQPCTLNCSVMMFIGFPQT